MTDWLQIAALCSQLGIEPDQGLTIISARQMEARHVPPFSPGVGVLLPGVTADMLPILLPALQSFYPAEHPVRVLAGKTIEHTTLGALKQDAGGDLYLPPVKAESVYENFLEIVAHLRAPDGCPWDREQTHKTLRQHLLEEAYETLSAMDGDDPQPLCEELGDLLLQVILNAQIAYENGDFGMGEVLAGIHRKIVRRHPHVFGKLEVDGVQGVLRNWEKLKEDERRDNGVEKEKGLLDGVPLSLPALTQAEEIQDRAARVGFDWADIAPVWAKVQEELEEVRIAKTPEELERELGDLLFAVVNLVRWYKVDAESALRATNQRFRARFKHIEQRAREQQRKLSEMSLEEMDVFWEEAKNLP